LNFINNRNLQAEKVVERLGKITIISGGARSGKSRFAEKLALESEKRVLYIATGIPFDEGMRHRIEMHKIERPREFQTVEMYKRFKDMRDICEYKNSEFILLDCLTLLITNQMLESGLEFESASMEQLGRLEANIMEEIDELIEMTVEDEKEIVIVSNEVGLGIVPDTKLGSVFRDISGRANQYIAHMADSAFMVFLGIPTRLK
jgi:adenosylcobinamide kinase / adenosylcobinamide-phosphate guanylyltransferase